MNDYVDVTVRLESEVLDYMNKVAELSGVKLEDVVQVIATAALLRELK